jgi:hypothetical protein
MGSNKVVREKFLKYQGISIDTRQDGSVHVVVGDQTLDLTEVQALGMNELLGDMIEWEQ